MKIGVRVPIATLLELMALFIFPLVAMSSSYSAQRAYGGLIDEIKGSADLITAGGATQQIDQSNGRGFKLHIGDCLRCGKGCWIRLLLKDGSPREINDSPLPFQIRDVPVDRDDPKVKALELYGARGGTRDTPASGFLWPVSGAVVKPEAAVFRWVPQERSISLILRIREGKELWRQQNVDGNSGQYSSRKAREALSDYRESGRRESLQLEVIDSDQTKNVYFKVSLSAEEEQGLMRELDQCASSATGLMSTICRAHSYSIRGMLAEVAQIYYEAANDNPASRDLLSVAIEAQQFVGDFERAKELAKKLPPAIDSSD